MEYITSDYIRLARIECDCCREDHFIELIYDISSNELYFESNKQPFSFKQRIGHLIQFKRFSKDYISGNLRDNFGIIIKKNQIEKLIKLLKNLGFDKKAKAIPPQIEEKNFIELFDKNGILFSKDEDNEFHLSIHPTDKSELIWHHTEGNFYGHLHNFEISIFLLSLKTYIGDFT